jgi:hypothetical protein
MVILHEPDVSGELKCRIKPSKANIGCSYLLFPPLAGITSLGDPLPFRRIDLWAGHDAVVLEPCLLLNRWAFTSSGLPVHSKGRPSLQSGRCRMRAGRRMALDGDSRMVGVKY